MLKAEDLARLIHARRIGKRYWRGRCPCHGGNSLEIKEGKSSPVVIKCQGGCATKDVLAALGLGWGDILRERGKMPKEYWDHILDERRLELIQRQLGLAILAQAVFPAEARYWKAVEQAKFEQQYWLRCDLYPEQKATRDHEGELQRIIADYGWDYLWELFLESEKGQQDFFEWGVTKE